MSPSTLSQLFAFLFLLIFWCNFHPLLKAPRSRFLITINCVHQADPLVVSCSSRGRVTFFSAICVQCLRDWKETRKSPVCGRQMNKFIIQMVTIHLSLICSCLRLSRGDLSTISRLHSLLFFPVKNVTLSFTCQVRHSCLLSHQRRLNAWRNKRCRSREKNIFQLYLMQS